MTTNNLTEQEPTDFNLVIQFALLIMTCYFIYRCINSESFKRSWEQAERDSERDAEKIRQLRQFCQEKIGHGINQATTFTKNAFSTVKNKPIENMQALSQIALNPGNTLARSAQTIIEQSGYLSNNRIIRWLQNQGIKVSVNHAASLIDGALTVAVPEIQILRTLRWFLTTCHNTSSAVPVISNQMIQVMSSHFNKITHLVTPYPRLLAFKPLVREEDKLPALIDEDETEEDKQQHSMLTKRYING